MLSKHRAEEAERYTSRPTPAEAAALATLRAPWPWIASNVRGPRATVVADGVDDGIGAFHRRRYRVLLPHVSAHRHDAAAAANRCGSLNPFWVAHRNTHVGALVREDGVVYHTYSTYARGLDGLWGMYQWLDRAPKGRNETGVWWRRHDEYDTG